MFHVNLKVAATHIFMGFSVTILRAYESYFITLNGPNVNKQLGGNRVTGDSTAVFQSALKAGQTIETYSARLNTFPSTYTNF